MQITGAEWIVFGVEDLAESKRFCEEYGLTLVQEDADCIRFEALDGSGLELRKVDDPSLPPAMVPGSTARLTIWGVKDQATLDAIKAELSKDREVTGSDLLVTQDMEGNTIGFRISQRHAFEVEPALSNSPGAQARPVNSRMDRNRRGPARTMGHVVFWSNNAQAAADFYIDRLGFRFTDGSAIEPGKLHGLFLRAAGHADHHSLFFLNAFSDKFQPSMQHLEFQSKDLDEVLARGNYLTEQGWKTHMGPGKHLLGSNWAWYFYNPTGVLFEVSADMDQVDDNWEPRVIHPKDNRGFEPIYTGPTLPGQKPLPGQATPPGNAAA